MTDFLANWWRSYQFRTALKGGNERRASEVLRRIEKSGAKLSWLEKLFQKELATKKSLASLSNQLQRLSSPNRITPDPDIVQFMRENFEIVQRDSALLQCTGIYQEQFDDFTASLATYLETELDKIDSDRLNIGLKEAQEDIEKLKQGIDPEYNLPYTPHVYFMRYFLDNVYCAYLAWFLIYEQGLLERRLNILDIGAGSGAVAYSLALLLRSRREMRSLKDIHLSYYSLEKQPHFQDQGLQFWRYYMEQQPLATNAYFRFHTTDIFTWVPEDKKIPHQFFDFIVLCHFTFADGERRRRAHQTFRDIFYRSLKENGHVLIIVQDKKLWKACHTFGNPNLEEEARMVRQLLEEMGLSLVWYKYLTSTGSRTPMKRKEFAQFTRENLPVQEFIAPLNREYLGFTYDSNYVLDDYIILARLVERLD